MDESIVAAIRFGYGAGPAGAAALVRGDARGWLKAQLVRPPLPTALVGLDTGPDLVQVAEDFRRQQNLANKAAASAMSATPSAPATAMPAATTANATPPVAAMPPATMSTGGQPDDLAKTDQNVLRRSFFQEVGAKIEAACGDEAPLVERLVTFWANHFTVSGTRGEVRPLAGAFEREAIRPHLDGRFEDMVLAVVQHPAMGYYLDNAVSIGPNSKVGLRGKRGVNENLGRELLELHTLGVEGGYSEEDVRALARILTGWSIARPNQPDAGEFRFFPEFHEPGPKRLLGVDYAENGFEEGREAIRRIANHPATAHHIARQLAVHFIADIPPDAAVNRLAEVFLATGGSLPAVLAALIDQPASWRQFGAKIKTPFDFVISTLRATGASPPPQQVAQVLKRLGQPIWTAPQPSGWGDDAAAWSGPEAVLRRADWAQAFAAKEGGKTDPVRLADAVLGEALDPATRQAVSRAESKQTALALLLASPSFQRR